ncbi:MAG: hypothetical protein HRF45_11080 [Fimbriimonadia bacterium]
MVALRDIVAGSRIGCTVGDCRPREMTRGRAIARDRERSNEVERVRPGAEQQNSGQNQGSDPPPPVSEQ